MDARPHAQSRLGLPAVEVALHPQILAAFAQLGTTVWEGCLQHALQALGPHLEAPLPPAAPPLSVVTGTTARMGLVLRVEQDYGYLQALAHRQRAV